MPSNRVGVHCPNSSRLVFETDVDYFPEPSHIIKKSVRRRVISLNISAGTSYREFPQSGKIRATECRHWKVWRRKKVQPFNDSRISAMTFDSPYWKSLILGPYYCLLRSRGPARSRPVLHWTWHPSGYKLPCFGLLFSCSSRLSAINFALKQSFTSYQHFPEGPFFRRSFKVSFCVFSLPTYDKPTAYARSFFRKRDQSRLKHERYVTFSTLFSEQKNSDHA